MKICSKCNILKDVSDFHKSRPDCKQCVCDRVNKYRIANKVKCAKSIKEWKLNNSAKKATSDKNWREQNKERVRNNKREWFSQNKEYVARSYAHRRKTDIAFKLRESMRNRLNQAVKNNSKTGSAIRDLGCSIIEFKKYIESKFTAGMTWDNWGIHGWHLDHIKPLSSFNLTNPDQCKIALHFTNLQPLWAKENLVKGSKV